MSEGCRTRELKDNAICLLNLSRSAAALAAVVVDVAEGEAKERSAGVVATGVEIWEAGVAEEEEIEGGGAEKELLERAIGRGAGGRGNSNGVEGEGVVAVVVVAVVSVAVVVDFISE